MEDRTSPEMATVLQSLDDPLKYRNLSSLFFFLPPSPALESFTSSKDETPTLSAGLGCLINIQGDESWEIKKKKKIRGITLLFYDER